MFTAQTGAWRGTGPRPTVKCRFFIVARGPVPRDLPTFAENARSPETPDGCCSDRGMARDRPSPYGEKGRFLRCYRSAGALGGFHTRIRAGFPRDLSPYAENARSPEATDVYCSDRCMARDRPSPYGEKGRFLRCYRSAGACPPRSLNLGMARDRPSPYGESGNQAWRGTGPRPT